METIESLTLQGFVPLTCIEQVNGSFKFSIPLYFINNTGRIYSTKKNRYLKRLTSSMRFEQVYITYALGGGRLYPVHRLLAMQFIPNPDNKTDVCFIEGREIHVGNLRWCSHSESLLESFSKTNFKHDGSYLAKPILCSNGKQYPTAKIASIETGCKTSNISMCCNGKLKSTKGYTFSFI